jgi:hypothetical protein
LKLFYVFVFLTKKTQLKEKIMIPRSQHSTVPAGLALLLSHPLARQL